MEKFENNKDFAAELDAKDPLATWRNQFLFPSIGRDRSIYFCGNSLGLQPKATAEFIQQELEDWSKLGVEGHMTRHFNIK